jgi:hypothetical protein
MKTCSIENLIKIALSTFSLEIIKPTRFSFEKKFVHSFIHSFIPDLKFFQWKKQLPKRAIQNLTYFYARRALVTVIPTT